jgi:DNA modification methylase/transcriptional regulator with XRE-family HTH domain
LETIKLIHGDCLEQLRGLPDCSVDSIVTDPPYGLSFMGKKWDYDVPSVEVWQECLRVLKHGGHLLAFAGTRTQHRMAVRIEDAGFEIRDMIAWVYGSGFPKSLDVSKATDKRGGKSFSWFGPWFRRWRECNGITQKQVASLFPSKTNGLTGCVANWELGLNLPTAEQFNLIRDAFGLPFKSMEEAEREVVGQKISGIANKAEGERHTIGASSSVVVDITAPSTDAAKQWNGWGTALKPALEPITVARKPLIGTVAENVLQHGTGAINVDGCRVGGEMGPDRAEGKPRRTDNTKYGKANETINPQSPLGRWPANFIHDGSEEATNLLGDSARFFYCAKASKKDRGENHHPTVKPTDLMRYLCRLVTPPNGIVLDPFMGSGSTGKAAVLEGFGFVGIEREAEYIDIAKARIIKSKPTDLFSD